MYWQYDGILNITCDSGLDPAVSPFLISEQDPWGGSLGRLPCADWTGNTAGEEGWVLLGGCPAVGRWCEHTAHCCECRSNSEPATDRLVARPFHECMCLVWCPCMVAAARTALL